MKGENSVGESVRFFNLFHKYSLSVVVIARAGNKTTSVAFALVQIPEAHSGQENLFAIWSVDRKTMQSITNNEIREE